MYLLRLLTSLQGEFFSLLDLPVFLQKSLEALHHIRCRVSLLRVVVLEIEADGRISVIVEVPSGEFDSRFDRARWQGQEITAPDFRYEISLLVDVEGQNTVLLWEIVPVSQWNRPVVDQVPCGCSWTGKHGVGNEALAVSRSCQA